MSAGRKALLVPALLLALAGCGAGVTTLPGQGAAELPPGNATNSPRPPAPTSGEPAAGAVTVPAPLDVRSVASTPCAGLTTAQLTPYTGAILSTEPAGGIGQSCLWDPVDTDRVAPALLIFQGNGGTGTVGNNGYKYDIRIKDIDGYPAEHLLFSTDDPSTGDCMTAVAVSAHDSIAVTTTVDEANSFYTNTCAATDALVTEAVDNLKAGA